MTLQFFYLLVCRAIPAFHLIPAGASRSVVVSLATAAARMRIHVYQCQPWRCTGKWPTDSATLAHQSIPDKFLQEIQLYGHGPRFGDMVQQWLLLSWSNQSEP